MRAVIRYNVQKNTTTIIVDDAFLLPCPIIVPDDSEDKVD